MKKSHQYFYIDLLIVNFLGVEYQQGQQNNTLIRCVFSSNIFILLGLAITPHSFKIVDLKRPSNYMRHRKHRVQELIPGLLEHKSY